jgi:hypothetical protein
MFPLAPVECSTFLLTRIAQVDFDAFIREAAGALKFVSNPEVYALWCQILRFPLVEGADATEALVKRVASLFVNSRELRLSVRSRFATFLAIALPAEITASVKLQRAAFAEDAGDVQTALRSAFLTVSVPDLRAVLTRFRSEMTIEHFRFAPPQFSAEVLRFFLRNNCEAIALADVLANLRGPWRELALAKITQDPVAVMAALGQRGKLHKPEILAFCSSLECTNYPWVRVVNFATSIFHEAKKRARIRMALRLLNTAMAACGELTNEFATGLFTRIRNRQESVSLMELTYTFRIVGDLLKSPTPIYRFLATLMHEWRQSSLIFEQLHVVHLRFYSAIPNDSLMGFYASDEEVVIAGCLHGKRPSKFLSGLRQFKSAIVAMDDARALRFTKSLSELLISKIDRFRQLYPVAFSEVRVLTTIVLQPMYSTFHQTIYDGLTAASNVPLSSPYFYDSIGWIPTAIRQGTDASRITRGLNLFIKVRSPPLFGIAARILTEEIRTASPEQKDALAMENYFVFLSDHADHQSYYTGRYLRVFSDIFAGLQRDTLFHFCVNCMKALRFVPVFSCLVHVIRKINDPAWTETLLEGILSVAENPDHRRAIEMIREGQFTREAFQLACLA